VVSENRLGLLVSNLLTSLEKSFEDLGILDIGSFTTELFVNLGESRSSETLFAVGEIEEDEDG